jgi:choice-of-anchor A domain-containing protein
MNVIFKDAFQLESGTALLTYGGIVKKGALLIATVAFVASHANGQNANADLAEWNVITSDNLDLVQSDIQGLSYVGGNVTVPSAFNVGTAGPGLIPTTTTSLAVVGNITGGVNLSVNGGSVVVGGTIDDHLNMNSGGTQTQNDPSGLPASPISTIDSASRFWSGLTTNSVTSVENNGRLEFNCNSGQSTAVFDISAQTLFDSGYQGFDLSTFSSTATVLINVSGSSVDWTTGNFGPDFNTAGWDGKVLFNFYQANTVMLSGQLGGYIVAPDANVTLDATLQGGIMCSNLTADGEIDLPTGDTSNTTPWQGTLPVSEPSSLMLAVPGILGMLAVRFRRR